jgi:hypothetical protein
VAHRRGAAARARRARGARGRWREGQGAAHGAVGRTDANGRRIPLFLVLIPLQAHGWFALIQMRVSCARRAASFGHDVGTGAGCVEVRMSVLEYSAVPAFKLCIICISIYTACAGHRTERGLDCATSYCLAMDYVVLTLVSLHSFRLRILRRQHQTPMQAQRLTRS